MTADAKRVVYTSLAMALVIIIAAVAVWLGLNKGYRAPSPLRVLPNSTTAVIRLGSRTQIAQYINETKFATDLKDVLGGDTVLSLAARIDTLFGPDAVDEPILARRDLFISYRLTSEGEIGDLTASFALNNRMEWHHAMNALKSTEGISVRDTSISGHGLFVLTQHDDPRNLYLAAGGGCLFASLTPAVPLSFGADSVTPMRDDPEFSTVERTITRTSPISLYINRKRLPNDSTLPLTGTLATALREGGAMASWMAIDLGLHEEGVTADGFLMAPRPSLDMLMARESTTPIGIARRLPMGIRHFSRCGAGPRGLSSKAFSEFLGTDASSSAYRYGQSELFRQTGVDVEALLSQVFSAEMALCSYTDSLGEDDFLVVDTRGGTMAQASLTQALTAMHGGASPLVIGEISPGEGAVPQGITSRRQDAMQVSNISVPVYGCFSANDNLFFIPYLFNGHIPSKLFFRYEDALVFADNMNVLRRVLVDYVVGNTMVGNAEYDELMAHFGDDCMRFQMDCAVPSTGFFCVSRQLTTAGRLPYLSIFAQSAKDEAKEPEQMALWKVRLDSAVCGKLYSVTNHYSQLSECILQDATNRIILIGADGMILWKRSLDGRIVGDISQIDYFANGKLQYLFATEHSIYIVDRLGNDVGQFPVHLGSRPVASTTATTYSDGSPLRIFVPTEGGVMLYGGDGVRVEGWNMSSPEGMLQGRGDHFVCNNKDYLVFHDQYSYYFCDRRGGKRLNVEPLAPSVRSIMTLGNHNASFVSSSADGSVVSIEEQSGKVSRLKIDSIGAENIALPLAENKYLIVGTHRAAIANTSGATPILQSSWPLNLRSLDQVAVNDNLIAVFDANASKAYIFASDGHELPCSPLSAIGSIALGHGLNTPVLFTIGSAGEVLQLPISKQ